MRNGVLLAVGANLLWGLSPLYWPLAEPAGAVEIVAHRVFWSAVVLAAAILALRRWRQVRTLDGRTWILITLGAIMISVNWIVYIYAVTNNHVVEASLGYFMSPLVAVLLGVAALGERLTLLQWAAFATAVPGVVLTALGAGGVPYLALTLAVTFGLYGLIKRVIRIPAEISLLGESLVLTVPAIGFLVWLQVAGQAHFVGYGAGHMAILVGAGLATAVPLLLFGAAARLLPLSVLGFLQYLNPLTQFLLGVWWAGEAMPPARWAGFATIWLSLVLLSGDVLHRTRRARRAPQRRAASAAAGGEPTPAGAEAPGTLPEGERKRPT